MINNNHRRLQDLILPFKIPMDTLKNFFDIYGKLSAVPVFQFAIQKVRY